MSTTSYKFHANTGLAIVNTANANLDGTGALALVLTGAAASGTAGGGTVVKSVTIKSTQATSQGMIRFFKFESSSYWLIKEVVVPVTTPTTIIPSFGVTVNLNITLQIGESLYASTQNSESFNIIADGLDFGSCACNSGDNSGASIQYFPNTGSVNIAVANSNLDGTGALANILTAANSASSNIGTTIRSLTIKGAQSTTQGMIRLFLNNGSIGTNYLFCEIPVYPKTTNSGVLPTISISLPANFFS